MISERHTLGAFERYSMTLYRSIAPYIIAFSACVCAASSATNVPEVSLDGDSVLSIYIDKKKHAIRSDFRIDGYEIDCSRKYAILWGHSKPFNPSNPQDSSVSVVDILSSRIVGRVALSKGVFSAEFLKDKYRALIWSDAGVLVRLPDGKVLPDPENLDFSGPDFERESCAEFTNKHYRRFSIE